jgi:hypothetical protein
MPSKEQAHSRDKTTAKQRPTQHEGPDSEILDWVNQPATIVQRAVLAPGSLTPEDVLRLQRTVGNRALLRLSGAGGPTPEPGAGAVRAALRGQRRPGAGSQRTVQRQEEDEELLQMQPLQRQELDEEEVLQAKTDIQRVGAEGGPVPPEVESAVHRARSGGQPLERAVQEQMSAALGHDFSGVRVHTDAEADALNQQLQAKAFTTGPNIFFKRGAYDPSSGGGRELIAHELTHVVQQDSGRVSAGSSGMTVWKQRAARAPVHAEPAWRSRGEVEGAVVQRNDVKPPILERQGHVTEEAVAATQTRRIVRQGAAAAAAPAGALSQLKEKLPRLTSDPEQMTRVTNVITGFAFAASIAAPVQDLSDRFDRRQTHLIAKTLDESIYRDPKTGNFPNLLFRSGTEELACSEESIQSFLREGSDVAGQKLAEYSGDENVYKQYVLDKLDNDEKAYERRVNAAGQAPRLAQKKEEALSAIVQSLLKDPTPTLENLVMGCYYLEQEGQGARIPAKAELTANVYAVLAHYNQVAGAMDRPTIKSEGVEKEVESWYE